MAVPNIFGTATSAIPLSQLDTNFATPVTIGNTAVQLGNTVTSFGNVTLTNVTISSGNVTVSAGSNTAPSITTVGDTNTGIFFPAADTIAFSDGGAEAMRIDSSGNVGIGTTTPLFTFANRGSLTINGTNQALLCLANGSSGFTSAYHIWDGTNYAINNNTTTGSMVFGTNAASERMRINSSGDLLVGTSVGAGAKIYSLATASSAIRGDASLATTVGMYGVHSSNSSTGYVAYFLNSGASNGQFLTNTGAWQAISDARLKTDVKNLDSTSRLLQLRPVDYLWKSQETSEEPSKRNLGFIAQEVKEVFPELVTVSPDGMFGVEYTGLISPLVKAIQEQQDLIQSLTTRITALEAK
jgi:hypothetical protein